MWRTEPLTAENVLDDLWIGVKGQSNPEIADRARGPTRLPNSFKLRMPVRCTMGVRQWVLRSIVERVRAQINS